MSTIKNYAHHRFCQSMQTTSTHLLGSFQKYMIHRSQLYKQILAIYIIIIIIIASSSTSTLLLLLLLLLLASSSTSSQLLGTQIQIRSRSLVLPRVLMLCNYYMVTIRRAEVDLCGENEAENISDSYGCLAWCESDDQQSYLSPD